MRDDDDEFLRSIPPFLRRREAQRPEAQRRPEKSPARLPGPAGEERTAEPISAIAAPADSAAPTPAPQTAAPRIVELAARQAELAPVESAPVETVQVETAQVETAQVETAQVETAQVETAQVETVQAGEDPAGHRARIALAFDSEAASDDAGAEDVAFQVTLPRSVVRQIRVLAAKKDTTQRAIVLRALRLAGLWVPEGTDVDRRGRTAKRRQQA